MSSRLGADDDDVLQAFDTVDLAEQLRHDRGLDVGATPVPRVRKIESISSKNTITGVPSDAFSGARWKISRICRSVSPTNLFSSSGALDVEEVALASRDLAAPRPSLATASWPRPWRSASYRSRAGSEQHALVGAARPR